MEREEYDQISRELERLLETTPLNQSVNGDTKENRVKDVMGIMEQPVKDSILAKDMVAEKEEEAVKPDNSTDESIPEGEDFFEEFDLFDEEDQILASRKRRQRHGGWMRKSDGLTAAFLVPVVIMIIIFAQRGIFPFGEESFLRTDMYHQYAPFFSEFRNKLTGGGNILYSWNIGMGVNFAALYAYYLASPLNWLLLLCPKGLVIEFMTYSIVLKIGLSGLSFAYYLRNHSKTKDFGIAFFGIFYALSGYMAAYSWNIMWLDCILLFPLIVLGLERLVKEKKYLLYCITLAVCITSNYYISIMVCIFLVLYFVALLILEDRKPIREYLTNIFHFAVFSMIAGGLAAVVLIPEIYALQATASGNFTFPKTLESYFPIFDMIARHLANIKTEIGLDNWPNIYCGVAVLLLFLLYLACKKISVKEKAVYCGLLLIFFASFSTNMLNFIWHGFHYPNSLPARQSFIYIFLILFMCYQAFVHLKSIPWKHVAMAFWGVVCFILLAEKLVTQTHFHFTTYYVAIIFISMYAGLIYLYKKGPAYLNRVIILTLTVVSVEAAVNTTITSVTITSRTNYMKDNAEVELLVDSLKPNSSFYRIDKNNFKTKNDGAWLNYPSASLFSSTANADVSKFYKKIGCESSTNAYSITGSTPLVDSLFAIKYSLYSELLEDTSLRTLLSSQGDTYLYENLYTLPVGFVVPSDLEDNWQIELDNPAEVQNDLAAILNIDDVLIQQTGRVDGSTLRFTPEADGDYYVHVNNRNIEKLTVSRGEQAQTFDNVNRGFFVELERCMEGEEVILQADEKDQDFNARIYRFSPENFTQLYHKLNAAPLVLTKWTDTMLEGTITTEEYGLLYTSIPYDKGWKVTVDGEERTTRKIFDTFLTVEIPEGTHTVVFQYTPEGLKLGAQITGGCAVLLLAIALYQFRKEKILKCRRRRVRRDTL